LPQAFNSHCRNSHAQKSTLKLKRSLTGILSDRLVRTKFGRPLNFASTAANITTLVAASLAFFANAAWHTREEAFAGATTNGAGSGSLAVTFRTQKSVWHLT
jgi:hypothetical protein